MESQVLEALQKGVATAVASSDLNSSNVKYVGLTFSPPDDAPYLELVHIPNNIDEEFWGEGKTYRGALRLVLKSSMNNEGVKGLLETMESILSNLSKGSILQDVDENVAVLITNEPDITGIVEDAPLIMIPATLKYHWFKA